MTTQLELELPGLDITPTGIDTIGIPASTALDALRTIRPIGATWRWWVGDLVLSLCNHDLTQQHQAWTAIAGLDIDDKPSLMRSVLVAAAFPLERRRDTPITWSHHELVHRLPANEADEWLRLASENRWSCHILGEQIKATKEQHQQHPLPGTEPPWRKQHSATLTALDQLFHNNPKAKVLLSGDGTWHQITDTPPPIETTGT